MEDLIKAVYIDRQQCKKFGCKYFDESSFVIAISDLEESKRYDSAHHKLFSMYSGGYFLLERKESDPTGWYTWSV